MDRPQPERLHALDALRGIMMMLGIVLHAAIPYSTLPTESFAWPLHDSQRSRVFDVLIVLVHSFRIPLFFLLSGFFMHLALTRKGAAWFVWSRVRRILVPFVLAFVLLTPMVNAGFAFALEVSSTGARAALRMGLGYLTFPAVDRTSNLMHLWFLYYLMLLYGLVLLGRAPARRLPRWRSEAGFASMLLLPVVVLSPGPLFFMESGSIDTPLHPFPIDARVLIFYLIWFMVGWALFSHAPLLAKIRARANVLLAAGTVALVAHLAVLDTFYATSGPVPLPVRLLNAGLATIVVTSLCFGILGAFARRFSAPGRVIRFLGAASYWAYLVHLPVVVVVAGLFQLSDASPFVEYPLVVAISSSVVLGSYAVLRPLQRAATEWLDRMRTTMSAGPETLAPGTDPRLGR
jgi:glucans biosynthesis protein C